MSCTISQKGQEYEAEMVEGVDDKNGMLASKIYNHTLTDEISLTYNEGAQNLTALQSVKNQTPINKIQFSESGTQH